MIQYAAAVRKGNDQLTESDIITTICNNPIPALYFRALHNTDKLHCNILMAYLKLLEQTQPDKINVYEFADMQTF